MSGVQEGAREQVELGREIAQEQAHFKGERSQWEKSI
jgi:hypothetical protein